MSECFVYFIHCVGTQYVKIGMATNVQRRLAGLQGSNPHELKVLGYKEGGRDLEATLHMFFRKRHVRGEWFQFRSVERALYIFRKYSVADLFKEMDRLSAIQIERHSEHSLRHLTPEQRLSLDAIIAKISAKMSRRNIRA